MAKLNHSKNNKNLMPKIGLESDISNKKDTYIPNKPATESQKSTMRKLKIFHNKDTTKKQASSMIKKKLKKSGSVRNTYTKNLSYIKNKTNKKPSKFTLASENQKNYMDILGIKYHPNTTFKEAMSFIDLTLRGLRKVDDSLPLKTHVKEMPEKYSAEVESK